MIGHPKVIPSVRKYTSVYLNVSSACHQSPSARCEAYSTSLTASNLRLGVDIICAQGGEGGGHTGETPFSILIPATVDLCRNAKSPLTGEPVIVVAAGGIADGRGLAAALS